MGINSISNMEVVKERAFVAAGEAVQKGMETCEKKGLLGIEPTEQWINRSEIKSNELLVEAVETANIKLQNLGSRCEFEVHDATNKVAIRVIDNNTDEVIREIPSESKLDLIEKVWELAGLIIDEKR